MRQMLYREAWAADGAAAGVRPSPGGGTLPGAHLSSFSMRAPDALPTVCKVAGAVSTADGCRPPGHECLRMSPGLMMLPMDELDSSLLPEHNMHAYDDHLQALRETLWQASMNRRASPCGGLLVTHYEPGRSRHAHLQGVTS